MDNRATFHVFILCSAVFSVDAQQRHGENANQAVNSSASLMEIIIPNRIRPHTEAFRTTYERDRPESMNFNPSGIRNAGKSRNSIIAARTQFFLRKLGCKQSNASRPRCEVCEIIKKMIRRKSFSQMHFYLAEPKLNSFYTITLPEGELEPPQSSPHAVAVVDPFIKVDFGHLVFVFYVYDMTEDECASVSGLHAEQNICLKLVKKRNCSDASATESVCGNCEVEFLPFVFDGNREETGRKQLLECQNHISGYGACPLDIVLPYERKVNCKTDRNLQECIQPRENSVRLPEVCDEEGICDYAIALIGGWNKITEKSMQLRQQTNVEKMTRMLLRNGFEHNKIQIFYHNYSGVLDSSPFDRSLPANNKSLILAHLNQICHGRNGYTCVDSLVLYLNSPTLSRGSMLLWDNNENGRPDRNEVLEIDELTELLTDCDANQIFLFVDQRYSNLFKEKFKISKPKLRRKVLLISNSRTLRKYRSEPATNKWARLTPKQLLVSLAPEGRHLDRRAPENYTIYGASQEQLQGGNLQRYKGCTAVKHQRHSFNPILFGRQTK